MTRGAKLEFLITALLALSSAASAQRNVNHVMLSSPSARVTLAHATAVHPVVMRLPVSPAIRVVSAQGNTSSSSTATQAVQSNSSLTSTNSAAFIGTQATLGQLLNPVPGLGFDFSNLAATNRDLGIRAIIDPVTQQELALTERLLQETPVTPLSFPFFASTSQPVVMLEQQPPQVILVQQPQPVPSETAAETSATSSPVTAEQPPLREVSEFVLVLRDGTQIKAIAFTRQGDRIVYVTKDGVRQSFPASDLDAAATQRLNQQRGAPLQLGLP